MTIQKKAAVIVLRFGADCMGAGSIEFIRVSTAKEDVKVTVGAAGIQRSLKFSKETLQCFPDLRIAILTAMRESIKMLNMKGGGDNV
jgi:hypothetical protein